MTPYPIPQKPIPPHTDLRDMLRAYLIRRSIACMEAAAVRRAVAIQAGTVGAYCQTIRETVQGFYGRLPIGQNGLPVTAAPVSSFVKEGYRIENILFESFPGWQVNATVFVPLEFEPPFPAVVVPVGHSGKQFEDYQLPCQFFARAGYLAITFDPPGQSGEKQPGNDHFIDGVRCYPLGETSSQYFIGDALRCVDYLATRRDVDASHGYAITGVSGGGTTTILAGLLDERLTVLGPSCCVTPIADLDIAQCYAGCPETRMWRRYAEGIDEVDLICAAAPKPILLMAGEKDTVFRIADTQRLAEEVKQFYTLAGTGDRFQFYVDPRGHCYSLDQAQQFVRFMDRWLRPTSRQIVINQPDPITGECSKLQYALVPLEELRCHPRTAVNMRTLASLRAKELRITWLTEPSSVRQAATQLAGVAILPPVPQVEVSEPFQVWRHRWQQIMLRPEAGIELPATFLYVSDGQPAATLLHFDDHGRHAALEQNGLLVRAVRFLEEAGSNLFTVDLRGWGDTAMALYPYELPWWGSRDRFTAYISAALGDPVMCMRIRDGLAALIYLRSRPECSRGPIVLSGCGLGGIVALHVGAIAADLAGVVIWESLLSLEWLLAELQYAWTAEAFIPNMLRYYDLPELAASLPCRVSIFNPLDAKRQPIDEVTLQAMQTRCGAHTLLANVDPAAIVTRIQKMLENPPG